MCALGGVLDKIMVGEKVEGVVLWTDYVNNLLLITLRPDHIANIDENQGKFLV